MRVTAREAPEDILVALIGLFAQRGFEGVSIGDIAEATGLGRSSLYHHFPRGKEQMAEAVIAYTRAALQTNVFAPLREGGDVGARIDSMLAALDRTYGGGLSPCVLAALLAGADSPLSRGAADVFAEWRDSIAETVADLGVPTSEAQRRARAALSLIQGGLVVTRALRDHAAYREAKMLARQVLVGA
jgi:TetR/AcrR family transcriptional regulator, lmrAB and yxaGH operons repressor